MNCVGYKFIREDLFSQIAAGRLKAGDRLVSENELAGRYGVAVLTVRRALKGLVDEGLLVRAPKRGTFVTEKAAVYRRILVVCGISHLEDIVPADWNVSPYHRNTVRFCREAAVKSGFSVDVVWPYAGNGVEPSDAVNLERYSGAIFSGCTDNIRMVQEIQSKGMHFVHLGKTLPDNRTVWFDYFQAMQLLKSGFCRDAASRGLKIVVGYVRNQGQGVDALASWMPGRIFSLQLPNDISMRDIERFSYQAVRDYCSDNRKPAAFIFLDDIVARGGTRAMLHAGMGDGRCPVAVACGIREMDSYGMPVTYVVHDTETEARLAVEMLEAQMAGDSSGIKPRQSMFKVGDPCERLHMQQGGFKKGLVNIEMVKS